MIETPTLRSSYYLKQDSQPLSSPKFLIRPDSPPSNRFKTPIRLRKLESQREMQTEILQISQYSPNCSSQASKLPSITQVNRKRLSKRTLSNIEPGMLKNNAKTMLTSGVKDDKVISISKLLSLQTEESEISSPSRRTRVTLKPVETRRKRDASGGHDRSGSCLSPRSVERISEQMKRDSPVNRDIADVLEPIAQQNSQKIKKVNKMISERDGGIGKSLKSKFEEEIFDAVKKRFIKDKLESDLRVIKPMHSEKFTLPAKEEAHFKLCTRNLKFPLQGKILSKASTSSYEIFASTKTAKPHLADCDYHFMGKKFLIETQVKVDCIYFTLLANTDLEAKLWILPDTGRKCSEEETPIEFGNSKTRESPTEVMQPVPENLKHKYIRLYPFVSYTPDQMEEFTEEIKQLKAEREVKTRKLAKDQRNIIMSNMDGIKKFNKGQLLEKIREFNKMKNEIREVNVERRDKMDYEDRIKKLIVHNKDEIKQEVKKEFIEETRIEEIRKERRMLWVDGICQNLVLHALAKRIWEFRTNRLITKIRNRSAVLIQRAYERYIFRKGNNKLLRQVVDIRQGLCFLSQMVKDQAHKKAKKVVKCFLAEYPLLQMIAIKAVKFDTSVKKIQKMAKRHCLLRRFQRLVLGLMIQEMLAPPNSPTEEETLAETVHQKITKKGEKGKKKQAKSVEKEKDKCKGKSFGGVEKAKNSLRAQFDKALTISQDLRSIVIDAYLQEVIQQSKQKYRAKIESVDKRDLYDEIDESNMENLKETCCTLAKTTSGSIMSLEGRNFVFETKESSLTDSKLMNSQKIGGCPVSLRAISREGLFAFVDENYVEISKSIKLKGDSKLLWLFN